MTSAFDRRRYIVLVQILALADHSKRHDGLQMLCKKWGINSNGLKYDEMIQALAKHAVIYHQKG